MCLLYHTFNLPMQMKPNMNHSSSYRRFALMLLLSFVCMYALMYAMVDTFAHVYSNINQFYMAALMTCPMGIIELILMRDMYPMRRWNQMIVATCLLVGALSWVGIRQQRGIDDVSFLRSMIPHHASALLMCQQASLQDPELKELCTKILRGQQAEINQMKAALERLK